MNKQEQTVLIWILIAASMVLLLLYSPWGSPDIYTKKVYFAENQGVNFSKINIGKSSFTVGCLKSGLSSIKASVSSLKVIKNSPKSFADNYSNVTNEIKVEDNYTKRKNENKISVISQNNSDIKRNNLVSYNKTSSSQKKIYKSGFQDEASHNVATSSGGMGAGNGFSMNNGVASSVKVNSNQISTASINSLNVDLTMFNDTTTMMGMDSPQKATSDPGDEPFGTEPVPVGEGWLFLLVLAAIYVIIKKKVFSSLLSKY